MTIITITGYKGGIGKSTTAIHLATYFAGLGNTVLVDGDPNRTALSWAARGENAPTDKRLPFLVVDERQSLRVIGDADFIIIDTPARPNSDDLKELAKGCELLVLPTPPDIVSLEPMLETAAVLEGANYRALLSVVPPKPSREGDGMQAELREGGVPVFDAMIRRAAGFTKAALQGVAIRDIGDSRAAAAWNDYRALGDEICTLLGHDAETTQTTSKEATS